MKKQLIAMATAVMLYGCSGNSTKTEDVKKTAQTENPPPPIQKAPDDIILSRTDTGKTDKIVFLVKNTTEPTIDRRESSYSKPDNESEKFICAQLWVKNISDKIDTIQQDAFKLFDQNDAEFVELPSALNHKEPDLFNPTYLILKPNESKSGWITFTTDKKSKAKKVVYLNVIIKL